MEKENKITTDQEVNISYIFNAPREIIFKAWTDPEQLLQWFAPDGCTIYFKEIDVRTGGSYQSCIADTIHGDCWVKGIYKEVLFPERIVYTAIISNEAGESISPLDAGMDADWPMETVVTITFEEEDGKTKVNLRQTVSETIAKRTGAHPSWIKMLTRLDKLVLKN